MPDGVGFHDFCNRPLRGGGGGDGVEKGIAEPPSTRTTCPRYSLVDLTMSPSASDPTTFCNRHFRGGGGGGRYENAFPSSPRFPSIYPRRFLVDPTTPASASGPRTFAPRRADGVGFHDFCNRPLCGGGGGGGVKKDIAETLSTRAIYPRYSLSDPTSPSALRGWRRIPGLLHRIGLTASGPSGFASIISGPRKAVTAP